MNGPEFSVQTYNNIAVDIYQSGSSAEILLSSGLLNVPGSNYINSGAGSFNSQVLSIVHTSSGLKNTNGFTDNVAGFMGFRFNDGTKTVYGWAEVILSSGTTSLEVVRWAYENDGSQIHVGSVPEPEHAATGLGALALGAAGLRRWRKSKKKV